ncbi:MAG TPA: tetratricopeptide repeat protein [Polyangiaceae bacterium]|jgi:hypothetical protein
MLSLAACGPGASAPTRPPLAQKWLDRGVDSYKSGDFDDARASADEVLKLSPHDDDARLLAARLALARLDYKKAIELTDGMKSTEAHGIRGRAAWYSGDLENAADELEAMLADPSVKDPWARDVAQLARSGGARKPFNMEGGVVALTEMPPAGSALVVPCEMEGEQVLTMIATGSSEVIVDSAARSGPSWVSLRFAGRIEVHDVPALTQDLSSLSRVLGAPIKALLGVDLLRHIHATFDRRGGQFVVRLDEPPSPPQASRLPLYYARGGAMLMRLQVAPAGAAAGGASGSLFYVDSSKPYSLLMQDSLWKRAGVDLAQLVPTSVLPNARAGRVPSLRLGGMAFPSVPALALESVGDQAPPTLDIDLGGIVGAGLLEAFRVTFTDEGRYAWVEPDPTMNQPDDAKP